MPLLPFGSAPTPKASDTKYGTAMLIPQIVASGVTFSLPTNTQINYSNAIITAAGGIILTKGTAAFTYVN